MKRIIIRLRIIILFVIVFFSTLFVSFGEGSTDQENNDNSNQLIEKGQKPAFDLLTREHGLSNMSVSTIIQDKHGYLWFGTQGGLNKYDGTQIEVIRNDPFDNNGLVNNTIQTMYYDSNNHELWIGTYQGLSRYFINENRFENYTMESHGLSHSVIVAIEMDKKGNLWIGTLDGLNYLNLQTGDVLKFNVPKKAIRSIKLGSNGLIYIGTYSGLWVIENQYSELSQVEEVFGTDLIMSVEEFEEGVLTLGVWDSGIYNYDITMGTKDYIELPNNKVYTTIKTTDKNVWVATWGGGFFAIKPSGEIEGFEQIRPNELENLVIYSFCQSDDNILWIGTNGGGVSSINPRKKNYVLYQNDPENENSLSAGKIHDLYINQDEQMWVGTYNEGLNVIDRKTDEIIKLRHSQEDPYSIPSDSVRVIQPLGDKLLIGTDRGVGFFDQKAWIYEKIEGFENNIIYDIEIIDSERIFIGTHARGVIEYNVVTKQSIEYNKESSVKYISDNHVYDILLDSKDRVWVATNNGLNVWQTGIDSIRTFYKDIDSKGGLPSDINTSIYEDSQGHIWIGHGDGGLSRFNEENSFVTYTETSGLSSNTVLTIMEDDRGFIWAATDLGISVVDKSTDMIYTLDIKDGIGGYDFSKGSASTNENMYFSGTHGIVEIPYNYSLFTTVEPRIYITDVHLYKKPIENEEYIYNDKTLVFGYKDDYLSIEYIAIDFDEKQDVQYVYMLDGVDKEYIYNGSKTMAEYTHLKPGKYTFLITALNNEGELYDAQKVYIVINPPWYESIYAYIGFIVLGCIVIYLIFTYFEGKLTKKKNFQLAVLNERLKIANEALEDLSTTDALTGVHNRRYFEAYLKEHIELARRNNNTYLSLLIIDVDNFKGINDRYGHIIGDKILVMVSQVMDSVLPRVTDMVARYGGDEFVVVLYDTPYEGAKIVAEKIRTAVEALELFDDNDASVGVTCSIGLNCILPDESTESRNIVELADKALYKAKESGKNQTFGG